MWQLGEWERNPPSTDLPEPVVATGDLGLQQKVEPYLCAPRSFRPVLEPSGWRTFSEPLSYCVQRPLTPPADDDTHKTRLHFTEDDDCQTERNRAVWVVGHRVHLCYREDPQSVPRTVELPPACEHGRGRYRLRGVTANHAWDTSAMNTSSSLCVSLVLSLSPCLSFSVSLFLSLVLSHSVSDELYVHFTLPQCTLDFGFCHRSTNAFALAHIVPQNRLPFDMEVALKIPQQPLQRRHGHHSRHGQFSATVQTGIVRCGRLDVLSGIATALHRVSANQVPMPHRISNLIPRNWEGVMEKNLVRFFLGGGITDFAVDRESVGASFCTNAWTRARRATGRDLESFSVVRRRMLGYVHY